MEAALINNNLSSGHPLNEAIATFFKNNTPDTVKSLFWKLFQCYVVKDCNEKAEVPDKDVALFYDQLIELVDAAYVVHQAGRASLTQKGEETNV